MIKTSLSLFDYDKPSKTHFTVWAFIVKKDVLNMLALEEDQAVVSHNVSCLHDITM